MLDRNLSTENQAAPHSRDPHIDHAPRGGPQFGPDQKWHHVNGRREKPIRVLEAMHGAFCNMPKKPEANLRS